MGELLDRRRDFLEMRELNMRERAKRGVTDTWMSAEIIRVQAWNILVDEHDTPLGPDTEASNLPVLWKHKDPLRDAYFFVWGPSALDPNDHTS